MIWRSVTAAVLVASSPALADDAAIASRVMSAYQRRLGGNGKSGDVDADALRKADAAEMALRLAALQAERQEIFRLARRRRISDDTARRLVRALDLLEERYR
jgi:CPA1 family monovalent cation:H+ antiporter